MLAGDVSIYVGFVVAGAAYWALMRGRISSNPQAVATAAPATGSADGAPR